ncbi:7292_t:CDS:2 [Entrophospora sp. SA101]|nr:13299_t:CDS:2 [Entrophospora sp. SA101]CAJ0635679.1 7292_t:CDS:2 [Entrophospora sp. SA101]CAJ0833102.1 8345_t:CDS:2 [Entrophospora sp. SA101]
MLILKIIILILTKKVINTNTGGGISPHSRNYERPIREEPIIQHSHLDDRNSSSSNSSRDRIYDRDIHHEWTPRHRVMPYRNHELERDYERDRLYMKDIPRRFVDRISSIDYDRGNGRGGNANIAIGISGGGGGGRINNNDSGKISTRQRSLDATKKDDHLLLPHMISCFRKFDDRTHPMAMNRSPDYYHGPMTDRSMRDLGGKDRGNDLHYYNSNRNLQQDRPRIESIRREERLPIGLGGGGGTREYNQQQQYNKQHQDRNYQHNTPNYPSSQKQQQSPPSFINKKEEPPLPYPWKRCISSKNKAYFFNTETRESGGNQNENNNNLNSGINNNHRDRDVDNDETPSKRAKLDDNETKGGRLQKQELHNNENSKKLDNDTRRLINNNIVSNNKEIRPNRKNNIPIGKSDLSPFLLEEVNDLSHMIEVGSEEEEDNDDKLPELVGVIGQIYYRGFALSVLNKKAEDGYERADSTEWID